MPLGFNVFLFFIILTIWSSLEENIVILEYSYTSYIPYISFSFNDNQTISLPVNTNSQYTFFLPGGKLFDECYEQSNHTLIHIRGYDFNIVPCKADLLYKNQKFVDNFSFLVKQTYDNPFNSRGLALSYKFEDKSYSFYHQLNQQHPLNKKQFSIHHNNQDKKGFVFFGGVPKTVEQFKHSMKCIVNETISSWNCVLNKITIGEHIIEYNVKAIFDTSLSHVFESKKFFVYITRQMLKSYFDKGNCSISEDYDFKDILYCDIQVIKELSPVTFEFNNTKITLPIEDLFTYETTVVKSKFTYDFYFSEDSRFVFGFDFIKKFNLTTFDYDKHSITFFSNNSYFEIHKRYQMKHYILYITCLVIGLGLIEIIYSSYKIHE